LTRRNTLLLPNHNYSKYNDNMITTTATTIRRWFSALTSTRKNLIKDTSSTGSIIDTVPVETTTTTKSIQQTPSLSTLTSHISTTCSWSKCNFFQLFLSGFGRWVFCSNSHVAKRYFPFFFFFDVHRFYPIHVLV
jgi:hypothetical protein